MDEVYAFAHLTGHCFSQNECVTLRATLPLLALQCKSGEFRVWGKVYGIKNDYIIAQVQRNRDAVATAEVFYSVDGGVTFTMLDAPSLHVDPKKQCDELTEVQGKADLLRALHGPFMGDPAYEYRVTDPLTRHSASYREAQRLALFIEEHDYHCRVAPRGAYYLESRHQSGPSGIRPNPAFTGLAHVSDATSGAGAAGSGCNNPKNEALLLANYYHIRARDPYRRLLSSLEGHKEKRPDVVRAVEDKSIDAPFSSLAEDIPSGVWTLRWDETVRGAGMPGLGVVVGENAQFRGSVFYHVPQTRIFGTVYIGDGNINNNVPWLL